MPESLGTSLVKTPSCREAEGVRSDSSPAALPLRLSSQFSEMLSTVRAPGPSTCCREQRPMVTPVPNLSPSLLCQGSSCRTEVS